MSTYIYTYNGQALINGAGAYYVPEPSLGVNPSSRTGISSDGAIVDFDIIVHPYILPWQAVERTPYSWFSLTPGSGEVNSTVDVSVLANTGSSRTGYIDVSANGVTTQTVTITQDAAATPSTIVVDFSGSPTLIATGDYRDDLVITGRQTGDQIDLTISIWIDLYVDAVGSADVAVYYSRNSTSSWTLLQSASRTATGWGTYGWFYKTIPNVVPSDTMRVRIDTNRSDKFNASWGLCVLTGGTFDTGSGTITASGTTSWQSGVGTLPP